MGQTHQSTDKSNKIRQMSSGSWYWVSKAVIRDYVPLIGFYAVGVYHFLASMVNESQCCFPSQKYIANRLGCGRSTVAGALKKLERSHLIRVTRRSRYHSIYHLLEVRGRAREPQMSAEKSSDDLQSDTNNTQLTISTNNVVSVLNRKSENATQEKSEAQMRGELLASDIADGLGDRGNMQLFLSYTRRFPETVLREALASAKQTPQRFIRKSRTALFVSLVRRYAP